MKPEKEGKIDFMKRKAKSFTGKPCIFRLVPDDRASVRQGTVRKAVYTGIHPTRNIHTFDVTIQGASGKIVVVDAVDHRFNLRKG